MLELEGRRILVTGCAGGIGEAICARLASLGAEIIAADLPGRGEAVAAQNGAHYLPLDVADENSWQDAKAYLSAKVGALEGLVNNAGIILMKSIRDTTLAEFRRVNAVNQDGVFLGMQYCLDLLSNAKTEQGAAVVNFSSIYGLGGQPYYAAYCASKGAVRLLTKAAALEFSKENLNVRVNSIHPGVIDTNLARAPLQTLVDQGVLESVDAGIAGMVRSLPGKRMGQPAEIADVVGFLLSDASRFMNGAEVVVDNGISARAQ